MGKRNVRIFRHQIPDRLQEIDQQEVHAILLDGTTFFGRVLGSKDGKLEIQDINARWTSKKKHTHRIPFKDISEIIFDVVAEY